MRVRALTNGRGLGATGVIGAGVGLAAVVVALADPVFRGLPYADADRLVSVGFGLPRPGIRPDPGDVPTLATWRARTDLFEDVAALLDNGWLRVRLADRVLPLRTVAATDNLLEVLGLQPQPARADPAAGWVSRRIAAVSGDALQIGRSVPRLPDGVLRVEGLLPRSFLLPEANRTEPVDALVVLPDGPVVQIDGMTSQPLTVVARVRPGVTAQMVEAALNVQMALVGRTVSVEPLQKVLAARLHGLALGALVAGGFVVLVCWANVFGMALTWGLYRAPEIATRTALGATRGRIATAMGADALRVATLGTGCALAVAWVALNAALPHLPPKFVTLGAPTVSGRVVLFVLVGSAVAGVAWYLASLFAWAMGPRRRGLQIASRDPGSLRRVRFALIAGQLAAASVVLACGALLGRSYLNLVNVDAGLDDGTQTLSVAHDPDLPRDVRHELVERTVEALRSAGGVQAVGASAGTLLNGRTNLYPVLRDGQVTFLDWTYVTGRYFNATGLQFLAGAAPAPGDSNAAVLTERAARELFGGRDPVGEALAHQGEVRIVGVVRDVRDRGLSLPPRPGVYVQGHRQFGAQAQTTYVLRVTGESAPVASWQRIVREIDPMAVVLEAGSIRDRLDRSVRDRTFATLVAGVFGLSTLLVAALGLCGVVSYTVTRRTREMAVRLALGATAADVTRLVVRDAVVAAVCGVTAGVTASVWLSRALESLLYETPVADPATLLLTAAGLVGSVLASAAVSGRQAGRIAPALALRVE